MKPRVVLATVGSLGDLHPFLALGIALRARGVDVIVACAADYEAKVKGAGLEFRPVRPSFDDMQRHLRMDRAQLTRAVLERGDFLFRKLIVPSLGVSYEDMADIMAGGDLVLTSSLAFGARLAAEESGIPWIAIVLQPLMFLSAFDPPVIPKAAWLSPLLRRLGPKITRRALQVVKFGIGTLLRPVHTLRREIGLAPTSLNPVFEGQYSSWGAIGLYSTLLGGRRPDYPEPTDIVGFASFDSADGTASLLDPALQAFLDAGDRPLVFTLGSLIVHSPGSFYEQSVDAARKLGQRAVLLVGDSGLADYLPLNSAAVHVAAYAPHSLLFPQAQAIIHQGGIGTLAQALRSGRPQLIVPFYADQADNAARARSLGVARSLPPRRYLADSAAREIRLLSTVAGYERSAATVRSLLVLEDGAAAAAQVVLDRLDLLAGRNDSRLYGAS